MNGNIKVGGGRKRKGNGKYHEWITEEKNIKQLKGGI